MKTSRPGRSAFGRAVGLALAISLLWTSACTAEPSSADAGDALRRKIRGQLRSFVEWLEDNDARGYAGEIGWPDDFKGDAAEWNRLAGDWFDIARANGLWVSGWATGEWWDGYRLSMYEDRRRVAGVDATNTQAPVFEGESKTRGETVGITVNGGEFGSPIVAKRSRFSNKSPGAYNTRYHYDRQGTFDFLAKRGMGHVRIPFRWERIQPRLGRALDTKELGRLRAAVGRSHEAGLRTILDVHNYGVYYLERGGRGLKTPIGSRRVTLGDFADLWRRLSDAFKGDDRILMYALMAEPTGLPKRDGVGPARLWEKASQRALDAVRSTGDKTLVAVPGYGWDALQVFMRNHKDGWIDDPANNFVYEVHHYWDHDHSGDYERSYADEVRAAERAGG
jgi:aryl-phospho-beta-D-glucosidase BglC (GH1 family)